MIKSQYLTTAKAVHNESHHTVRKTEYNAETAGSLFSFGQNVNFNVE